MEETKNIVHVYKFLPAELEKKLGLKGAIDRVQEIDDNEEYKILVVTAEKAE